MLVPIAAVFAALIFLGMAVFQALLAAGLPLGHYAWGGQQRILPPALRWGSLVSAFIFLIGIFIVCGRAGLFYFVQDTGLERIGIWVLVGIFSLSTLGNLSSKSKKEQNLMTPTAIVILALCLFIALKA